MGCFDVDDGIARFAIDRKSLGIAADVSQSRFAMLLVAELHRTRLTIDPAHATGFEVALDVLRATAASTADFENVAPRQIDAADDVMIELDVDAIGFVGWLKLNGLGARVERVPAGAESTVRNEEAP